MDLKIKFKEWARRYSVPMTLAILAAILSGNVIKYLTGNNIIAGIAATWVDNIVFYGYISLRDISAEDLSWRNFFKQIRNMIIEFGPAEYLDSFYCGRSICRHSRILSAIIP